ncbi:MAG: hypothetical protein GXO91_05930, partial [FCB group bacterium]|nr:hypothetical protein [FCB group bacterium]
GIIISLFILFFVSSCDIESADSNEGTLTVSVIDNSTDDSAVPGISITIVPEGIIKQTDLTGKCSFELDPGDYYVDAEVCCIGPGNISYHEPVTLTSNQTTEITLVACSACL